MIIKKVILKPSGIEGLGVFAEENIKKGDQVCDYDSELAKKFEISFSEKEVLTYPKNIKNFILKYSYEEPLGSDNIIVSIDYDKFVNHSNSPNISFEGAATRNIAKGEELTYDYKKIDTDYKEF
jgi:SET domain-containing protein|tara:strand:- start:1 stop:372 length:372 start_codon:yes stop_codon:yes gene_type:complete